MAIQLAILARNARLDAIETYAGGTAILKVYDLSGTAPANCASAITATVLATCTLPADWMDAAADGAKAKLSTWSDTSADAAGTADFFRLFKNDGTTTVMQGTVGVSATDMTVDNAVFAAGQTFTVTTFTLTDGNA